ncbi:MAG: hypothetical protein MZV70_77255 [Desulfobacterales bacterium]|nr:hypothetical protein [Desulfobacterales bacterium]
MSQRRSKTASTTSSFNGNKKLRYDGIKKLLDEVQTALAEKYPESEGKIAEAFSEIERADIRKTILEKNVRARGRASTDEIRQITCELDVLPRAHGSALFTRGETQSLAATTLGTKLDVQRVDNIQGAYEKTYMLHYNFPPYSVGEVKRVGSVSRREIGHGHLAERSGFRPYCPVKKVFP